MSLAGEWALPLVLQSGETVTWPRRLRWEGAAAAAGEGALGGVRARPSPRAPPAVRPRSAPWWWSLCRVAGRGERWLASPARVAEPQLPACLPRVLLLLRAPHKAQRDLRQWDACSVLLCAKSCCVTLSSSSALTRTQTRVRRGQAWGQTWVRDTRGNTESIRPSKDRGCITGTYLYQNSNAFWREIIL